MTGPVLLSQLLRNKIMKNLFYLIIGYDLCLIIMTLSHKGWQVWLPDYLVTMVTSRLPEKFLFIGDRLPAKMGQAGNRSKS